ncbi:MAG: transketolase [Actinobacteria bacterium]|nr:transketolase [Actinomycetota bacterium]
MKEYGKHKEEELKRLKEISNKIRCSIVTMVKDASVGHIGGSLSVTDILVALYFKVLNIDPKNPDWENRDRLVLSKGHGATAIYSVLAERGFFPAKELETFGIIDSKFQVHPDKTKVPGIEASTGALGQGLSVAAGMALAARLDNKDYHTYAILGDGEIQEGQIWEAAMFSAHYKLDNLTAILDYNNVQLMGDVPDIMGIAPVNLKWESFGWNVVETDGHDFEKILTSIDQARNTKDGPTIIIADTTKGKGVSFMQDTCTWHGNVPSDDEYEKAIKELKNL